MEQPRYYTIEEVSAATGVTRHTLHYYERAGLLLPVDRAPSGHRRYTKTALDWIILIRWLRKGRTRYFRGPPILLRQKGDGTFPQRLTMIEDRLVAVNSLIEELKETRTYLEQKKQFYRAVIAKRSPREVTAIRDKLLSQALGDERRIRAETREEDPAPRRNNAG